MDFIGFVYPEKAEKENSPGSIFRLHGLPSIAV